MNLRLTHYLMVALLGVFLASELPAQTTEFTYQGELRESGAPANGIYDLKFELLHTKGSVGVITNAATTVSNGLFTVTLDFGWDAFTGTDLWLEIGVATNGGGTFVTLSPRQSLTSVPYAIQARTASVAGLVSGNLSANQLTSGTVPSNRLGGTYSNELTLDNRFNEFAGTFSGDGSGLSGISVLAASDGSPTNAVYVDEDGNVGIGTSTPREGLEVDGGNIRIQGTDGYDEPGETASLYLGSTQSYLRATRNAGVTLGTFRAPDAIAIQSQTGNVGLGTNDPATALHVVGTVKADDFEGQIDSSQITGTLSFDQLALGAAAENLAASGQSGVPNGGMILARDGNNANLLNAGYVKLGKVDLGGGMWSSPATSSAPSGRMHHTAIWTGSKMLVWGGSNGGTYFGDGGIYDPSDNTWAEVSDFDAPPPRMYHTAIWTGSEMIIWGGEANGFFHSNGSRYDPTTDTWRWLPDSSGILAERKYHTAIWTGSEMIIWGGANDSHWLANGARYDPATDRWTALEALDPSAARGLHTAVWTGDQMIMWGGFDGSFHQFNGNRYNLLSSSWIGMNPADSSAQRSRHTAIWTGSEMIVWGGYGPSGDVKDGIRYNPVNDDWAAMSDIGSSTERRNHAAVWTGQEMLVWGGWSSSSGYLGDGGRYDPAENRWSIIEGESPPSPRQGHTAVWTGSEMIIWGGQGTGGFSDTVFHYTPSRILYLYERF